MVAKRSDADRRAAARLSDFCAERARCQHVLDLKRRALAAEIRRIGGSWHTPAAVDLDRECWAALHAWEDAAAAVVAELTARRQLKEAHNANV